MNFFKKIFGKKALKEVPQNVAASKEQEINVEEEFAKTIDILSEFKRTAYLPIVKKNVNSFSTKSEIGGYPYLRHEED